MNKLSKQKQQQLLLTVIVIAIILSGLWFGLISFQKKNLQSTLDRAAGAKQKMEQITQALKAAPAIESELLDVSGKVAQLEKGMLTGDPYSWFIETIRQFKLPYRVDIPQYSQVDGPKDSSIFPNFPYKQATLSVGGTAYFYDLGKFIADFENEFPFARIVNLVVEPATATGTTDAEKLSFKMDIVVLVKPGTAT